MRRKRIWPGLLAVLVSFVLAGTAQAYVDPGTQAAAAAGIAGFVAMFAGFFGIVLWPFRWLVNFICKKTGLPRVVGKTVVILLVLGGTGYGVYALDQRYAFLPDWGGDNTQDILGELKADYGKFERVMILGMDGLDTNILEDLMEKGELPNFSKLRKDGSYARLQTSNPPQSPVAWSSIATGCNPGKHGIFDFIQRDPKNYAPYLSISKSNSDSAARGKRHVPTVKIPGFWDLLTKAGVPMTIVRWPNAFPPPAVKGRFLSGLGVPDILDRLGVYSFYSTNEKHFPKDTVNHMEKVTFSGDKAKTVLRGPQLSSLTGQAEQSTLPVEITKKGKRIEIAIEGKKVAELGVGDWSDYIPVKFGGALNSANGIVRFLLLAVEPDLKLYASPINIDPMDPYFQFTHPDSYGRELAEKIGRFFTFGMPEDVKAYSEEVFGPEDFLSMAKVIQVERDKMFDLEFDRFEKGFFGFVYDGTDRKQHMFWAARDPEHPAYNAEYAKKYDEVIPAVYKRMDTILGKVLPKLDDKTALIVLSDHGFTTYRRSVNLNTWLVENGYQKLRTKDGKDGRRFFQDVDWSQTKAYSLGFNSIYINLKGREDQGIVAEGSEYRDLCDEIAEKLRDLRDPKSDKSVVKRVYNSREIYAGDERANGPDLIVGFVKGFRASSQNVLGAAPRDLFEDNTKPWSGSHLYDPTYVPGIFLSNLKIRTDNPSVFDIAPSVLQCFGMVKPEYMDGQAIFELGE